MPLHCQELFPHMLLVSEGGHFLSEFVSPSLSPSLSSSLSSLPAPDRSCHRRTSAGEVRIAVGTAELQPPERMPENISDKMPDKIPDGMRIILADNAKENTCVCIYIYTHIYIGELP